MDEVLTQRDRKMQRPRYASVRVFRFLGSEDLEGAGNGVDDLQLYFGEEAAQPCNWWVPGTTAVTTLTRRQPKQQWRACSEGPGVAESGFGDGGALSTAAILWWPTALLTRTAELEAMGTLATIEPMPI